MIKRKQIIILSLLTNSLTFFTNLVKYISVSIKNVQLLEEIDNKMNQKNLGNTFQITTNVMYVNKITRHDFSPGCFEFTTRNNIN